MGDYRSKSFSDGGGRGMDMEIYYPPTTTTTTTSAYSYNDYRSHSASYASSSSTAPPYGGGPGGGAAAAAPPLALPPPPGWKIKEKGKSKSTKSWSLGDAEFQRKKRVASYKVYTVEGKVKGSFKKSFRWVKDKCTQVVYGWW